MTMMETATIKIVNGLAIYTFGSAAANGEPIFFMPGPHRFQRVGLRSADALITLLVALNRCVITFDPPGSGKSTRPAHLSMEEMHDCTTEVLRELDIAEDHPIDMIGHSMGGYVLVGYVIDHPQQVKRLILVGTGRGGGDYSKAKGSLANSSHPSFWKMVLYGILHIVIPRLGPQKLMLNFMERQSFVNQELVEQQPVTWKDWMFHPRGKEGRTDWHYVARRINYRDQLHRITCPTLVVCGKYDSQFPLSCSIELAQTIPNATLKIFEHSGHYPFIEEPDKFQDVVKKFLTYVES